jgi:hypothetical protein
MKTDYKNAMYGVSMLCGGFGNVNGLLRDNTEKQRTTSRNLSGNFSQAAAMTRVYAGRRIQTVQQNQL